MRLLLYAAPVFLICFALKSRGLTGLGFGVRQGNRSNFVSRGVISVEKLGKCVGWRVVMVLPLCLAGVIWAAVVPNDPSATGNKRSVRSARYDGGSNATSASTFNGLFFLEDLVDIDECLMNPAPECTAFDYNGDGVVNNLDYSTVQLSFGGHDCNGNRISDTDDISVGSSLDVNGNGFPDDCETVAVAGGQAPSANEEGIPSNIDWSDQVPNVVVSDDFFLKGDFVSGVRWWGGKASVAGPTQLPTARASVDGAAVAGTRSFVSPVIDQRSLSARDIRMDGGRRDPNNETQTPNPTFVAQAASPDGVTGLVGDTCAEASPFSTFPFSTTGNTCAAVDNYDEACGDIFDTGGRDVVLAFAPAVDVLVDVSLCGNSNFDTKLYIYKDACQLPGSGLEIGCNEDDCSTPSHADPFVSSLRRVDMKAGSTYFIIIDGFSTVDCGTFTLEITPFASPPVCTNGLGDCFAAHPGLGCENQDCCERVCALDTFCCDKDNPNASWDQTCADEASQLCLPAELPVCPEDSMFSQPTLTPADDWIAGISDGGWHEGPLNRFENFSGLPEDICDVHWWGLNAFNDGNAGFSICNKSPDVYTIQFHADNLGEPGAAECTYVVTPRKTDTGLRFAGFPLYAYDVELETCCALTEGWVSIQGRNTGNNCLFLWMGASIAGTGFHWLDNLGVLTAQDYELSLCLTPPPPIDGWLISFHEFLDPPPLTNEPLGLYFCDAETVARSSEPLSSCSNGLLREYEVDLVDCCLIHANPDARTESVPAQPGGFEAFPGLAYDLDIEAVAGARWVFDGKSGECIEQATTRSAPGNFWAWQTTFNNFGFHPARQSSLSMGLEGEWIYGPWSSIPTTCGQSNMAFELLTLRLPEPP